MKILRKKLTASVTTEFAFDVKAFVFLVKNLTDGDILVCFDEFDENASIKIPAYNSQQITQNADFTDSKYATNTLQIQAEVEGEVEVQCLKY